MKMRFIAVTLGCLLTMLIGGCDLWPKDLKSLADSIARQVSGETSAWLLSGDIVVIDVAGSPFYREPQPELEATAIDLANQVIVSSTKPLESIIITFHEEEVSEDAERMREFIFLVIENRPVLQPDQDLDASGPLTLDEVQLRFIDPMDDTLTSEQKTCVLGEVARRARMAGDPETLDPANVEFLSAGSWSQLDSFGKRLILAQAITTKAFFVCAEQPGGVLQEGAIRPIIRSSGAWRPATSMAAKTAYKLRP